MLESFIIVNGQPIKFSDHAAEQIGVRGIDTTWIVQTLENPVLVIDDENNNSLNYFGRIAGKNPLLKVALSKSDTQLIATVYFDSPTTRRYDRGEI